MNYGLKTRKKKYWPGSFNISANDVKLTNETADKIGQSIVDCRTRLLLVTYMNGSNMCHQPRRADKNPKDVLNPRRDKQYAGSLVANVIP